MKKTVLNRLGVLVVIFTLIVSIIPLDTVFAESNKGHKLMQVKDKRVNGDTTSLELENNSKEKLVVKVKEKENSTIYETYLDNKYIDKTITYKDNDKIVYYDNSGAKTVTTMSDYVVTDDSTSKNNEDKRVDHTDVHLNYSPPSGYSLLKKEYSSAWGHWGYLYGKTTTSYGETKKMSFSAGTAVSTIIGVIGGIFTGGIGGILLTLGASAVGATIDVAISGSVYARTKKTNYEVKSQNKLSLRTNATRKDAKVINSKNGNVKWVYLSSGGDTRSRSDMIHAGIYNVVIGL